MDYEEFINSRERVGITQAAQMLNLDVSEVKSAGYDAMLFYEGLCYIGVLKDHRGYHLHIERDEWTSTSLSDLEPILFDWYSRGR